MAERPLEQRFLAHLRRLFPDPAPARWVVAVSGGCDSVALLYLLRFCARELELELTAAHLDHAMRPGSAGDAAWVAGLCAAWQVPLVGRRLPSAPAGEDEARRARYAFLRDVARSSGAEWIATAHHADDQAETVLFRALRGTGLRGLRGIRPRSPSGLVRPLLPYWRDEIETFARARRLRWRTDPTNLVAGPARNRIRLELLPLAERTVAPAARRNLVALAALAAEAEDALDAAAARAARALVHPEGDGLVLARARLRVYDEAISSRLLRKLLRRFGVVLGRTGTRTALQFITQAPSGREMQLPGGVRVRLEFDRARLERELAIPPDQPLLVDPAAGPGGGSLRVGGRLLRAEWRVGPAPGGDAEPSGWSVALPLHALRPPLRLRGWIPGDRMATAAGTKPLKKLFGEHRIPRSLRARLPVLVDAAGAALWVAGVPRRPRFAPRPGEDAFILTLLHD